MNRNRIRFALASGCVALLGTAAFSGLPGSAPFTGGQDGLPVVSVAEGISHLVSNRGGNIGVSIGEDGILLIDDLFPDTVGDVEKAVKTLADGDPVYVINTHWHGDHTGGNAHFGQKATILAHENVRRRLVGDESIGGRVSPETLPRRAWPTITYEEGLTLRFNGDVIRLFHVGGGAHTDGDSIVWFTEANVVHMGDLYFQVGYPFVDTDSGGDVRGIIAAVKYALDTVPEDAKFIPGHGQVTGAEGLREYLEMLETITSRVEELLAEDFTVEEMFEIVKHDLFRWAIMQAGTLPRKEFVFGGVFDDELFAEIREKKLATMLAREMIETEPKWLQYEFEEAQVKIDIGDMILEQMVTETIGFLQEKSD